MKRIITVKKNQQLKIVLIEKHKIKDIIGYQKDNKEFQIDIKKLIKHIKGGVEFSNTAFNLIYKILVKLMLKIKKI